MKTFSKSAWLRLMALGILVVWGMGIMCRMPGTSYTGPLEPLTAQEAALRDQLLRDVDMLAGRIGERNLFRHESLEAAARFVEASFREAGYEVARHEYRVRNLSCRNIGVEVRGMGRPDEIVVVGAHYDSVLGSPGANDNATGAAAVLALARVFAGRKTSRTVRFLAFVNEEPPFFQTRQMGSLHYAMRCRQRGERIVAMMSLETIGFYSDAPGSQRYPWPLNFLYPGTANFIGFVGSFSSRELLRNAVRLFREHARFPSEGVVAPQLVPGVGWSDHWSFWQEGYPAIMITDTALYRYSHYHAAEDTPDKIDPDRLARVVAGLESVIKRLASPD